MTRAFTSMGSERVRFTVIAVCAFAFAGAIGVVLADRSVRGAHQARALASDAIVAPHSRAASASTSADAASSRPAAKRPEYSAEIGARTDQIWELSIGADSAATAGAGVAPIDVWRIGGVFESDAGPALIVVSGIAGPPRYLRVGELLPNRAKITAITPDTVTVSTKVNKRWVLVSLNV